MKDFHIEELLDEKSAQCERILRALPEWFGIESALISYCKEVAHLPVLVARKKNNEIIGLLSLLTHNAFTTEVHVIGVLPEYHRHGVGRSLVESACVIVSKQGGKLLEVKTVGLSHPNPSGYIKTIKFYEKLGFLPVEEFAGVWPGTPCLVMVKIL